MRKVFDYPLGVALLCGVILFWPYIGGWKAATRHPSAAYDPESVLLLSFVGVFLQFIAGWRVWEWYYDGQSLWAWVIALAAVYAIISIIRLFLHLWGTGGEDNDDEAWNASHR